MALTPSTMDLPLGTALIPFQLPDTDGKVVSVATLAQKSRATLVIFMCNHCPYVIHIADQLATLAREYMSKGVVVIGVNSNDAQKYPDDAPEKMRLEKAQRGYTFPYVFDEDQAVAKAYRAACTPDFFLFDHAQRLVYRGQFDDARPKSDKPVTGKDLRAALDLVLAQKQPDPQQKPSMGCNIKWRPGNEPQYFQR